MAHAFVAEPAPADLEGAPPPRREEHVVVGIQHEITYRGVQRHPRLRGPTDRLQHGRHLIDRRFEGGDPLIEAVLGGPHGPGLGEEHVSPGGGGFEQGESRLDRLPVGHAHAAGILELSGERVASGDEIGAGPFRGDQGISLGLVDHSALGREQHVRLPGRTVGVDQVVVEVEQLAERGAGEELLGLVVSVQQLARVPGRHGVALGAQLGEPVIADRADALPYEVQLG